MPRVFALAALIVGLLTASDAGAYQPSPVSENTRPYDADLPHGATLKLPKAGLDFLANQMESGLQGNTLRRAIVEALEGQYFEIVLPIFGGNLRLTIPCGQSNSFLDELYFDKNYNRFRPWCPYVRGTAVRNDQVAIAPVTTQTDEGFRYRRVELEASTYPPANITFPRPNSLFAALYLLEEDGKHSQLDMVPEHPLFKVQVPSGVDPLTGEVIYTCFNLLGSGAGCASTFVATLEADLITGGQLKPFFDDNTLFVLVNNFNTALVNLRILTPITQNTALMLALEACGEQCADLRNQVLLLYDTVEVALGDAALQFFERELNAALSGVLQDGINQLMFDRAKDGTPDPVINLKSLASGLTELSGKPFDFNFDARYESSASDPVEAYIKLDGGIFAGEFDSCVNPGANPAFHYTQYEADGNAGHDPPALGDVIPELGIPYQLGGAFSDDFVNQIVYNVWASGLLCVTLSPDAPDFPPELAELLVTESFAPFVRWLPELAPKAPVSFRITPISAPYVTLGSGKKGGLLQIHLDELQLDAFVKMGEGDQRNLRVFSLNTAVMAAVEVNAINLDAPPLLDLNIRFESSAAVAFNDLHPETNKDLEIMVPAVLDAMAPSLAELVGNLEIPLLTDCIGGLKQRDLVVRSAGFEEGSSFANYLELYINFDGELDFEKVVSKCALALTSAPPVPVARIDLGVVTQNPAAVDLAALAVDPAKPYRWRLDGGFWSHEQTGPWAPRLLLDGRHRVEFSQGGRTVGASFMLDSAAPVLRLEQQGNRLHIEALDKSPVSLRIGDGEWIDRGETTVGLKEGRQTVRIVAKDAAGHEVSVDKVVVVRRSAPGCATGGDSAWLAVLLFLAALVRRPPTTQGSYVDS
jgi:hypothetical protein